MHEQDYAIIRRILGGEKKAYAELVERHKDKAMTLAMKMLKNREDAEEALQDAFIRAFNALPRFEWKSSFSTWFFRIVYNVCATELGKRGGQNIESIDEEVDGENTREPVSTEIPPDIALESSELNTIILQEIDRLPGAYGPTFALFFIQDMSYEQIVEVTGLPLGTIKARLFRARVMLRDAIVKRLGTTTEGNRQEKVA
ncbi:MAG TPA: sigma-70 family RNA polymerase sigma factor [Bacteroidota bacterium]